MTDSTIVRSRQRRPLYSSDDTVRPTHKVAFISGGIPGSLARASSFWDSLRIRVMYESGDVDPRGTDGTMETSSGDVVVANEEEKRS